MKIYFKSKILEFFTEKKENLRESSAIRSNLQEIHKEALDLKAYDNKKKIDLLTKNK